MSARHHETVGKSDDWYTPPAYFDALDLMFDLDPCSPGHGHWVPARKIFTKADDGLAQEWFGLVFMNPPFGGRNGQVPWLRRFFAHGNGIAIVMARTSAGWFHDLAVKSETMLFPRGKTKFVKPDGSVGRSPGSGIVMLGVGAIACDALHRCGLGLAVNLPTAPAAALAADQRGGMSRVARPHFPSPSVPTKIPG